MHPLLKVWLIQPKIIKAKLKGLKRINLVEQKQNEEKELKEIIEEDPLLQNKYGNLLGNIEEAYNDLFNIGESYLWFRTFNRFSKPKLICRINFRIL